MNTPPDLVYPKGAPGFVMIDIEPGDGWYQNPTQPRELTFTPKTQFILLMRHAMGLGKGWSGHRSELAALTQMRSLDARGIPYIVIGRDGHTYVRGQTQDMKVRLSGKGQFFVLHKTAQTIGRLWTPSDI